MAVVIEEFDMNDMSFTVLGRIKDGEVVDDQSGFLTELLTEEDLSDERQLLERFNGPRLIAHPDTSSLHKEWIPYEGPRGGEGWQNTDDPDVVLYQEDPPGDVADGYDADHWQQYPSENDWPRSPFGTEWEEPTGFGRDGGMNERDAVLFVNYDDELQVSQIANFRPAQNTYELENGYVIGHSQLVAHSEPDPQKRLETSVGMVNEGDWITYDTPFATTYTARITNVERNEGHDVINVVGEGGYDEIEVTGQENNRTEYNSDIQQVHDGTPDIFDSVEENGMAMDADEIADEVTDDIDISSNKHVRPFNRQLHQEKRQQIRNKLEDYFPKQYVDAYYGAIESWKIDNADGTAQEHEVAFKEALGIEAPTHAEEINDVEPSRPAEAHTKIATVMAELSNRFWEENFGSRQRVHRGVSNTAFEQLFETWLENPSASEYNLNQLALNNYSVDRDTAADFGRNTAVVTFVADKDDVTLCTDFVSNIGTVEDEAEVQIHGDGQTADARDIRLLGNVGPSIGEHPEDWFRNEHKNFGMFLGSWYLNKTDAVEDEEPPLPEQHYETLLIWADALAQEYPELEDENPEVGITVEEIREDAQFYYGLGSPADHPHQTTFDGVDKSQDNPVLDLSNEDDATWLNEGSTPPQRERMSEQLFEQLVEQNRRRRREAAAEQSDEENRGGTPMRLKARAEVDSLASRNSGVRDGTLQKAGDNFYQVDDLLIEAWEKQVCADSLEKAPNMWRRDDSVPQFVRSFVRQAATKRDSLWDEYNDVPHMAALRVHEIIKDNLTNPNGWSIETIADDLTDDFEGISQQQAETIARTEVAAVLNKARSMAYDASGEELRFYWSGPSDKHTTDLCEEVKTEIENRGGYVDKQTLKQLLRKKARKFKDDGGTPERVDSFLPHYRCRHTLVRSEFRFM